MGTMLRRTRAEELRPTVAGLGDANESHGRGSRCLGVKPGHVALTSHRSIALRRLRVRERPKDTVAWFNAVSQGVELFSGNKSGVLFHLGVAMS